MDRKTLEEYCLMEQRIRTKRERIRKLKNMELPENHDKVRGSNPEFPYQPMNFHVSGCDIRDVEKKRSQTRNLVKSMERDVKAIEGLRLEVEKFIEEIPDMTDQLIFTYVYLDGLTQEQAAKRLHIDQSNVSKRIAKYFQKNESRIKIIK